MSGDKGRHGEWAEYLRWREGHPQVPDYYLPGLNLDPTDILIDHLLHDEGTDDKKEL
jgi:hypothetical protein